jgi:hypothetical protein
VSAGQLTRLMGSQRWRSNLTTWTSVEFPIFLPSRWSRIHAIHSCLLIGLTDVTVLVTLHSLAMSTNYRLDEYNGDNRWLASFMPNGNCLVSPI